MRGRSDISTVCLLTLLLSAKWCVFCAAVLPRVPFAALFIIPLCFAVCFQAFCDEKKNESVSPVLPLVVFISAGALLFLACNLIPESSVSSLYFKPVSLLFFADVPFCIYLLAFRKRLFALHRVFTIAALVLAGVICCTCCVPAFPKAQTINVWGESSGLYARTDVSKSDYTGVSEGKNVAVIELPSFLSLYTRISDGGGEITPNVNAFLSESVSFTNFMADTDDTAFTAMNSLYPSNAGKTFSDYPDNTFNGLPRIMTQNGYTSYYISALPSLLENTGSFSQLWGFESYVQSGSDSEAYAKASSLLSYESKCFIYISTVSSAKEYIAGDDTDDIIAAVREADRLFGEFYASLRKSGVLNRTAVIIYGVPSAITVSDGRLINRMNAYSDTDYTALDACRCVFAARIPHIKSAKLENLCSLCSVFPAAVDMCCLDYSSLLVYADTPFSGEDETIICFQNGCRRGSFIDPEHVFLRVINGSDQIYNYPDMSYGRLMDCMDGSDTALEMLSESEEILLTDLFSVCNTQGGSAAVSLLRSNLSEKDGISIEYKPYEPEDVYGYINDISVRTILLNPYEYAQYTVNAVLTEDGWHSENGAGRVITGDIELSSCTSVKPYLNANGDTTLYANVTYSASDVTEATGFIRLDEDYSDAYITFSDGAVYVNDGKIVSVRLIIDLPQGVNAGYLTLSGNMSRHATGSTDGIGAIDLDVFSDLDGAVRAILSYYENPLPGFKITDLAEAMAAFSECGCVVFEDKWTSAALRDAVRCSIPILCKAQDGTYFAVAGYSGNKYTIIKDKKTLNITLKELNEMWTEEVVAAVDRDPELTIIEDFIPLSAIIRPGYVVNDKKYIVIHNTGNYGVESDAQAHNAYLHAQAAMSDPRKASWHYTVDDEVVYYHIPDNESAWHASDGTFGDGNYYGIGIEICVNGFPETYSGAKYEAWLVQFKKALDNSAKLTASLIKKYGLTADAIKQHYDFAPDKKNCPMQMRYNSSTGTFERHTGDMWLYFLDKVDEYLKN